MTKTNSVNRKTTFITKWSLLTLFIAVTLAGALSFYKVDAANPTSGTLAPTQTTSVTWVGTGVGPTTNDESTCVEGVNCDSFTLTLSGNPSDWTGKTAHIEINWLTVATDYDLYVHQGSLTGAVVASSATGTTTSEAVDLSPSTPAVGTGVFVVHVLYFAATAADQYSGTASVRTATGISPATQATGPAPRFQNFIPQQAILNSAALGTNAGEPSIGVNWRTGKVFFQSNLTTFRVTFDDTCPTTPVSTWEDKSPATSANSLDPIMFTDHSYNNVTPTAGRTIVSQLSGTTSLSSTTDNDGDLWVPSTGGGLTSGVDHQTVGGTGQFHAPLVATVYPNATYYCSQDIGDATCAFSADGGQTYAPAVPIYTLLDCGGLHGHVKVGPDGSAYVPNKGCGGAQAAVVSENNGATWTVRPVPNSMSSSSDPAVAIGRGDKVRTGRVYFGYANNDSKAVVAVSDDNGRTWKNFADVGAIFNINSVAFPVMIAGDDDRASFSFMGSATGGDGQDRAFPGFWHLYVATTYDGGLTWVTVDATPNDVVQRNGIWLGGGSPAHRNLLDFIGSDADKTGHILVGYADGCTGPACVQAPNGATGNSYTALSSIARQTGGRTLFASNDANSGVSVPGAPTITVGRNGKISLLTLSQSDNGGSAITSYRVLRGTTSGGETLLATIPGTQITYNDLSADANTTYYYRVIAANAQGDSCGTNEVVSKPLGSSCVDMKIISDGTGDQRGAPADDDLDIQSVSMAETYLGDNTNRLIFKMKIANPTLLPNRQYRILWNYPTKSADIDASLFTGTYYAGMNTDANGVRSFEYGTVTTVETVPANTSTPNRIGAAEPSSSYDATTGTISIVINNVKIGSPTVGDIIGKLVGRTFAGNGNQTVLGTSAIDSTATVGSVDPYTAASYRLIGNAACLAPTAAGVTVSGRVMNSFGRGISGATVTITDNTGNAQTARTNAFGYYGFSDIAPGDTYVLAVFDKRYNFGQGTQVLTVNEAVSNIDFVADPSSGNDPRLPPVKDTKTKTPSVKQKEESKIREIGK